MQFYSFDGTLFSSLNVSASLPNDTPDRERSPLVFSSTGAPGTIAGMQSGIRTIPVYFMVKPTFNTETTILALIAALDPDNPEPRTLVGLLNDGTTYVEVDAWVGSYIARPEDKKGLLVSFYTDDDRWRAQSSTIHGAYAFTGSGSQTFTVAGQGRVEPSVRLGWATQRGSATATNGWKYRRYVTITNSGPVSLKNVAYQLGPIDTAALVTAGKMQSDCDDLYAFDSLGRRLRKSVFGTNQKCTFLTFVIDELAAGSSRTYAVCYGNASATHSDTTQGFPLSYPGSPSIDVTGQDGTAGASAAGTLVLTAGASLDPFQYYGGTAIICSDSDGLAGGQYRRIASHTTAATATLTLSRNWTSTPDATCHYVLAAGGFMGDGGAVTSATSSSLTDSSQTWNTNEWKNATVEIVTLGSGNGTVTNTATVISNTSTALTVGSWSSGTPSAAQIYRVYKRNGNWIWRVSQDRRTLTKNRGRWRVNPALVRPSNIYDAAQGSPGAWTWGIYNPYNAKNAFHQNRYSYYDTGGSDFDSFAILDAEIARDGTKFPNRGFANAVMFSCPFPILGVRHDAKVKNPSAMAMAFFGAREGGGDDWSSYFEYTTAQASLTTLGVSYYDLTGNGDVRHLIAALTSVDGSDIPKTTTGTAQLRDGTILEARVDTSAITVTDFDAATEEEVYDYTLTVRRGSSTAEEDGDDLVIVGGTIDGEERHVFVAADEDLWVGPLGDLPYAARVVQSAMTEDSERDLFTDANGTNLESHAPTSGGTWTKHSSSGAGSATIDNNRVHNTNDTATHIYYHSTAPASADYDVAAKVVMRSDNNLSWAGVAGRMDTSANTAYFARYQTNGNIWQLFKVVAGVSTQIGSSVSQTLTVDQEYELRLLMRGSWLRVTVDGLVVINDVDTAITAAGRAGVRMAEAATSTVGVHLDDWRLFDSYADGFPTIVADVPGGLQVLTADVGFDGALDRFQGADVLPLVPGSTTINVADDVGTIGEVTVGLNYKARYL